METILSTILLILMFFCCMTLVFCLYIIDRNDRVYEEKMRVLNWCSEDNYVYWKERIKIFKKYTYDEIAYHFWKPVKSFYKDVPPRTKD